MPLDSKKADEAVQFFRRYLRHTKGRFARSPFILEDWQAEDIIKPVFGTVNEDGTRQYRQVLVEIPRKNGKSEIAAGVANKLTFADREPSAEVYSAAADREQAAIVYDVAEQMVRMSPPLMRRARITTSRRNIAVPSTNSKYRVVSADGGRQHGLNPHGVLFDEVHTQRNRRLWDAMTMGSDTRSQPLIFAITTAGVPDEAPVWWDLHEYARQCREGIFDDPTFLSIHFGADLKDDFDDPAVWKKANPALGTFLSLEKFKANWQRARRIPSEWNEFLRYRLNVPTQQADRWLDLIQWDACARNIDWSAMHGQPCWLGLDLSTRRDITALVACFRTEDGRFRLYPHFWLPSENVPARLKPWVQAGLIETTDGNAIDFQAIRNRINEFKQRFIVMQVAVDPQWQATQFMQDLMSDGFEVVAMTTKFRDMNVPSKEFEASIADEQIEHDGNPVLRWMADCVSLRINANGEVMPEKPNRLKSEKRIDGIVAAIMARSRAALNTEANAPQVWSLG